MHSYACPKSMTYGPCGGVSPGGSFEVPGVTCPFVPLPVPAWVGPAPVPAPAHAFLDLLARRPVVVTDFPARALDARSIGQVADVLAGAADAVLLGDHPGERVQFPPAYRASLVTAAGLAAWGGLNCRDRNRIALEGELAALAHVGVAGVHCVTGDHPAVGHRPDAQAVFDLDSTQLVALARAAGLLVSAAEAPCSPPVGERPRRLAEKVRAGAQVGFVNHAGSAETVGEFAAAARAAGADIPLLACVPVVLGVESAALPMRPVLPPRFIEGILAAPDTRAAGIAAAVRFGEELLAQPGIAGLNLSVVAERGAELNIAAATAEIGRSFLPG